MHVHSPTSKNGLSPHNSSTVIFRSPREYPNSNVRVYHLPTQRSTAHVSVYQLSNSSCVRICEGMRDLELHTLAITTLQEQLRLPHRLLSYRGERP